MKIIHETVDDYINHLNNKEITQLRNLCVEKLKGYTEVIRYGMPCYLNNDSVEIAFASQKNYFSFYVTKQGVMDKFRPLLKGLNTGKGCIRFRKTLQIDFKLIEMLLQNTFESKENPC